MGYLRPNESDLLHLPSNPEFWVRMKRKAEYGDSRAAQNAMLQVSQGSAHPGSNGGGAQMVTAFEVGAFIGTLTVRLITEWNLTDANDQILPITIENLDLLDDEDGEFLSTEAQKRKGGRPEEREVPFEKLSGRPSMGMRSKNQK